MDYRVVLFSGPDLKGRNVCVSTVVMEILYFYQEEVLDYIIHTDSTVRDRSWEVKNKTEIQCKVLDCSISVDPGMGSSTIV